MISVKDGRNAPGFPRSAEGLAGISFLGLGRDIVGVGIKRGHPENVVRTAQAMMGVKIIYSIIPIALSVLIIIVSYTYKINAANHTMIKEKSISAKRLY